MLLHQSMASPRFTLGSPPPPTFSDQDLWLRQWLGRPQVGRKTGKAWAPGRPSHPTDSTAIKRSIRCVPQTKTGWNKKSMEFITRSHLRAARNHHFFCFSMGLEPHLPFPDQSIGCLTSSYFLSLGLSKDALQKVQLSPGIWSRIHDGDPLRMHRVETGALQDVLGALSHVPVHQEIDDAQAKQIPRPGGISKAVRVCCLFMLR